MNFVRKIIEKRVNFLMGEIERLSKDMELEDGSIVENANASLINQKLVKKIVPIQVELTLYLNMGLQG